MRYTTRFIVPPRVRRSGLPGSPGAGPRPQVIGVRRSLGFGDPLGIAAAHQVSLAVDQSGFAPFFVQGSPREIVASGRTPQDVLAAAGRAVGNSRFRAPWGADADLLRTPHEVDETAAAGFTYFTIDLSEHVRADAADLSPEALAATVATMVAEGELPEDWAAPYVDRTVDLPGGSGGLRLGIEELRLAAVKFGRAVHHGVRMYETVSRANRGRPYEIEISLSGIAAPVSTVEHLFLGLELEARGVRLTALGLQVDDRDPGIFDEALGTHVAIASFCGPYKLSFRSGTHYPALAPIIGRRCGDLLHYKTSDESCLEAWRLVSRLEPALFHQLLAAGGIEAKDAVADPEATYLDDPAGAARVKEATARVLVHGGENGPLRDRFLALLEERADVYAELLVARYGRLIEDLNAG